MDASRLETHAHILSSLVGIGAEIQATDLAEVDEESVKEKVTRV